MVASSSPHKTRPQQPPSAGTRSDTATDGPTIADLTAMVQQLCLENRCLEHQLAERELEVEELQDDLLTLHHGLSSKL